MDGTDAKGKLHLIVFQTSGIKQAVISVRFYGACCFGVCSVTEYKILHTRFVGCKLNNHNTVGVGCKIFTLIVYTVFMEAYNSESGIQREGAFVVCHAYLAQSCFNVCFSQTGVRTETERSFAAGFVICQSVEIAAGKLFCFFLIPFNKCLSYFRQ